jgi:hypothetical protein
MGGKTTPQPVQAISETDRLIKNSQARSRPVQEILHLDLVCLQQIHQKQSPKRLTAVYREIRGWLRGCLRVGDVPFPAGNFHRNISAGSWQGLTNRRKAAAGALSVVDPAELRLAV